MIVKVSGQEHYRLRTVFKPFMGTFYSQFCYDTLFAKDPLLMTEDDLLWHTQIGNMNIPPAKMRSTLVKINDYRRNFRRKDS